jgi:hypothetical protein
MNRDDAQALAERLGREHPERATHRWVAREIADGWEVVKVRLPEGIRRDPLKATTEAKPKPPQADDPRPSSFRQVPPYGPA